MRGVVLHIPSSAQRGMQLAKKQMQGRVIPSKLFLASLITPYIYGSWYNYELKVYLT